MEKTGIPEKLIRLPRICVEASKSRVGVKGKLSAYFEVKTGVKEGDCSSPLFLNFALEKAIKRVAEMETGLQYAGNKEELRDMMKVLVKENKEVGQEINIQKTKYLPISRCHNEPHGNRCSFSMGKMLVKIIVKNIKTSEIQDYNTTSSAVWCRTMDFNQKNRK
ncbi:hypothetical protein PR048_001634 [Dryococelus australis]|uniref:Reverse transcriptase domain-containing protein n=1 Tax=Dryococelus australis TaxID=614101 RepID=A0ABQ9IJC4_9NEOP|nr:hypothetical protein PR048_001634 [Dryococelus australis]